MEGEERASTEGGGGGLQPGDEGAGGARPSGEAAGAQTLHRIPESCSTVTYWAERSKVSWEKGLWASVARQRQAQRNKQSAMETSLQKRA